MASKPRIKTVRCVIATGDKFLLAIHNNGLPINHRRWGLVGGRVDRGEAPEAAVRREVREELYIDIGELTEVGDFRYKGAWHRVFGVVGVPIGGLGGRLSPVQTSCVGIAPGPSVTVQVEGRRYRPLLAGANSAASRPTPPAAAPAADLS